MKKINYFLIILTSLLLFTNAQARQQSWSSWVQDLRKEALSQGVRASVFDQAFHGLTPMKRTIALDRSQPETRLTFAKYRKTRGDAYRIRLGQKEYKKYYPLLSTIGRKYGVNPCMIVSLWGIETSYGRYMGNFPVIRTLATLAYDTRRSEFFRRELLVALQILNDGHVPLNKFKGEWAGASGQPQFLPSSWKKFAVDYNGDGYKNIWTNYGDAFASIANYLIQNGWSSNQPWAVEVRLPNGFNRSLEKLSIHKTVSAWLIMGVQVIPTSQQLPRNLEAAIITPYGGPSLMIFHNFDVIKRYNNSTFYAGTVSYMADKICMSKRRA